MAFGCLEVERDTVELDAEGNQSPVARLARLKAIGPQIAAVLYLEGLYRSFANRREESAYAGLVPTPWRSGTIDREQGISKAGNRRLRHIMIELAWLWVRHQPDSASSLSTAVIKAGLTPTGGSPAAGRARASRPDDLNPEPAGRTRRRQRRPALGTKAPRRRVFDHAAWAAHLVPPGANRSGPTINGSQGV
jgi:hypothetical protein